MRTNHLVRALFLLAIGTLGASSATAQSVVSTVIAHCPVNGDASAIGNQSNKADLAQPGSTKSGESTSAEQEKRSNADLAVSTSKVRESAKAALQSIAASPKAVSLLDEHKLNVKVAYDARPVGGILTVRVSISPTFSGIGVSTRPATSRSVALAVDEFSQEMVNKMVEDLTEEIQAEFKAMNEASAEKTNAQVN